MALGSNNGKRHWDQYCAVSPDILRLIRGNPSSKLPRRNVDLDKLGLRQRTVRNRGHRSVSGPVSVRSLYSSSCISLFGGDLKGGPARDRARSRRPGPGWIVTRTERDGQITRYMTSLHAYFHSRDQAAFQRHLSTALITDVNARDWLGRTVLHLACAVSARPATEYVRLLLAHPGIDVNLQDVESHWTALHRALYDGNIAAAFVVYHPFGITVLN